MQQDPLLKSKVVPKAEGQLASQYEILELLDSGGMGIVYKARNVAIDQIVAIKMIQSGALADRYLQRFKQESAALASLDHFNIVKVNDFGFTEDQQPYMVLEYVNGQTLSELIKNSQPSFGFLSEVFSQVTDALAYAHSQGVLHRDLKPSNIMVQKNEAGKVTAKIIDFGIAKFLTAEKNSALTQTGELLGSPTYMSPEQIGGNPQDERADVYSLGCVMFEAYSGSPPFQADTPMDMIFQHLNADVPSIQSKSKRKIPRSIESLVTKCLQKDPSQRIHSMLELHQAINDATTTEEPKMATAPDKKRTAIYVGVAALLLIGVCSLAAIVVLNQQADQRELEAARRNRDNVMASRKTEEFVEANAYVEKYIAEHKHDIIMSISDSCNDEALRAFTQGDATSFATRHIKLSNADVKGPGLAYLIRIPLMKLELQRSSLTDRGMLEISKMKTLLDLSIDSTTVSPASFAYLHDLNLMRLSVRDVGITDEALKNICQIPSLENLQLDGNSKITNFGFRQIARLHHLDTLSLRDMDTTDELVEILAKLPSLRRLNLNHTNVTDEQLKILSTSKTLREIQLDGDENVTNVGLRFIVNMPNFDYLELRGNKWLKDSDLKVLSKIDHKFHISVEETGVTDATALLISKSKCDSFDMASTRISDVGLKYLSQSKFLKRLRLSAGGSITEGAVEKFKQERPDVKLTPAPISKNLL